VPWGSVQALSTQHVHGRVILSWDIGGPLQKGGNLGLPTVPVEELSSSLKSGSPRDSGRVYEPRRERITQFVLISKSSR
jgi:hypothetical protein